MSVLKPFSIDTRTLMPGDTFVALDGARQKGYLFLEEAFRKGASSAVCAESYRELVAENFHVRVQFVPDPVSEMARLAHEHRNRFEIPVVGIAGSVGKTSTKQFLAYLLSRKQKILATAGNLNNQLGLPMMLSRLNEDHALAVLEMGADHIGDLARLVAMAEPTLGILTPIAPEHLQGFGSLAGVYDGELELLRSERLKTLVTAHGDPELDRRLRAWKGQVIRVGFSDQADVVLSDVRVENGKTFFKIQGRSVILPTSASFLALNAGLAAALAIQLGYEPQVWEGEWLPEMPQGRFMTRELPQGVTIIDDTYNSSPQAFSAALQTLKKLKFSRKWIVFSDMLELGNESAEWHAKLGDEIAGSDAWAAWSFGTESKTAIERIQQSGKPVQGRWFFDAECLARELTGLVRDGDLILFKGSRGMRVEKVLAILEAHLRG